MDRIENLKVFVEVAEAASFAKAAARLARSPAAITRAVAELESRLGVRLLNRTTRVVNLTGVGQNLLSGAKRVLADLDEIEQAAAGEGQAPRGELAVTAPIVFGRLHVLPVVTEFLGQNPNVTLRLVLADRPVDLIEEGLDVAIRIGALADSSAIAVRLGAVCPVIVAAPAYLELRGVPKRPRDLAGHDTIEFTGLAGGERWQFRNASGDTTIRIAPRLTVTTAEAAIDAAVAGCGITRVISYQAAEPLAKRRLVQLLAKHHPVEWPVHMLYPGGRFSTPKLRAFVDFAGPRLRRRLSELARNLPR